MTPITVSWVCKGQVHTLVDPDWTSLADAVWEGWE